MASVNVASLESSSENRVFVRNMSTRNNKGNVVFNVPREGGGVTTVEVPSTYLPYEVTDEVSKTQLVKSDDFRRAVHLGLLRIVTADEAEKALRVSGADEEVQRIRDLKLRAIPDIVGIEPDEPDPVPGTEGDGIYPAVMSLVGEMNADTNPLTIINSLRTLESELKVKDFEYIKGEAEKLGLSRVQSFCKKKIAKMETSDRETI